MISNSGTTSLGLYDFKRQIDAFGGVDYFRPTLAGGYLPNARVMLTTGEIVQNSTTGNLTNDPNTDMTGWVLENSDSTKILTIESFGGKTMSEDPLFDNSDAFDALFSSYYPLHGITSGITFSQLESAVQTSERYIIRVNGMYRTTRPINLPPNTTWEQSFEGYFAKDPKVGIFYDPLDLNTYAFGGVLYKKQPDLTYNLDTDVMTTVTGAQFDNGEYFMAAVRQQLINPFIVTKRGVTLGYRLMGWAGNYAVNLACGENNGTNSRNPKVAFLTGSCWGAKIDHPNTLSTHQGHVHIEAGGGFVVNEGYINSGVLDAGIDRTTITPIYQVPNMTETGTIGLTLLGECYHHNPVAENWAIGHVSTHQFHIFRPHMERIDKYAHYLINCEGIIDFKGVTPVEALSVIYLKDYQTFDREVRVRGTFAMGGTLVKGENSDPSIVLDIARSHSFIQFYEWGDINLVKSVINKWDVSIYVDSVAGNDNYVGLRDIRALKTLTHVKKLCDLFGTKKIVLTNNLTVTGSVNMPNKFEITGAYTLINNGLLKIVESGNVEIEFKNTLINGSTSSLILYDTPFNTGYVNIQCDIDLPSSTFAQSTGDLNLDVNITNGTTYLSLISYCPLYAKVALGWSVKSATYSIPYRFDGGGGYFKYISDSLSQGVLSVTSQSIPVNAPVTFDVSVIGTQVGDICGVTFSSYVNGLTYTGIVSTNGNVKVSVNNETSAPVTLPSGTLYVKMN